MDIVKDRAAVIDNAVLPSLNEETITVINNHQDVQVTALTLSTNSYMDHHQITNREMVHTHTTNQNMDHHQTTNRDMVHTHTTNQDLDHHQTTNRDMVHTHTTNSNMDHHQTTNRDMVHTHTTNQNMDHHQTTNREMVHTHTTNQDLDHHQTTNRDMVHTHTTNQNMDHHQTTNREMVHTHTTNQNFDHHQSCAEVWHNAYSYAITNGTGSTENSSLQNGPNSGPRVVQERGSIESVIGQNIIPSGLVSDSVHSMGTDINSGLISSHEIDLSVIRATAFEDNTPESVVHTVTDGGVTYTITQTDSHEMEIKKEPCTPQKSTGVRKHDVDHEKMLMSKDYIKEENSCHNLMADSQIFVNRNRCHDNSVVTVDGSFIAVESDRHRRSNGLLGQSRRKQTLSQRFDESDVQSIDTVTLLAGEKPRRGRPKKDPLGTKSVSKKNTVKSGTPKDTIIMIVKKKRGRPASLQRNAASSNVNHISIKSKGRRTKNSISQPSYDANVDNFTCEVCNKEFTTKSALDKHGRLHTRKSFHHCNECGKSFTFLKKLLSHQQRMHKLKRRGRPKKNEEVEKGGPQSGAKWKTRPSDITAKPGSTAILKCQLLGNPGFVTWNKDGVTLAIGTSVITGDKTRIAVPESSKYSLVIKDVKSSDAGDYTVTVENVLPESDKVVKVSLCVQDVAESPSKTSPRRRGRPVSVEKKTGNHSDMIRVNTKRLTVQSKGKAGRPRKKKKTLQKRGGRSKLALDETNMEESSPEDSEIISSQNDKIDDSISSEKSQGKPDGFQEKMYVVSGAITPPDNVLKNVDKQSEDKDVEPGNVPMETTKVESNENCVQTVQVVGNDFTERTLETCSTTEGMNEMKKNDELPTKTGEENNDLELISESLINDDDGDVSDLDVMESAMHDGIGRTDSDGSDTENYFSDDSISMLKSCVVCLENFTSLVSLARHMAVHYKPKKHLCLICGKGFDKFDTLYHHKVKVHGKKSYQCQICEKVFKSRSKQKEHISAVHDKAHDYPCPVCGKLFTYKCSMVRHQITHTSNKPFSCTICGKRFNDRGNVRTHMMIHSTSRPHKCDADGCGKAFKTLGQLKSHKMSHEERTRYICDHCGKGFLNHGHMLDHVKQHNKDFPWICSVCGKGFANKQVCKRHERIHNTNIQLPCEVCGKTFTDPSYLERHKVIHLEPSEKPFECTKCGKKFAFKFKLGQHVKTHQPRVKVRKYLCTFAPCGKGFFSKGDLDRHMIIHGDTRPFKCKFCDASFSQKYSCVAHERKHSGEKPYACTICGAKFARTDYLKRHSKWHDEKYIKSISKWRKIDKDLYNMANPKKAANEKSGRIEGYDSDISESDTRDSNSERNYDSSVASSKDDDNVSVNEESAINSDGADDMALNSSSRHAGSVTVNERIEDHFMGVDNVNTEVPQYTAVMLHEEVIE